ncbi:MAG: histidine phosphatase family protein [Pseudomonadota bacterium]
MSVPLLLVRHAEAEAGWGEDPDPGLSDAGQQQATRLAIELHENFSNTVRLVSSPMRRAQETVSPLASLWSQTPEIDDRVREVPSPVEFSSRGQWIRQFMTERWSDQPPLLQDWRQHMLTALSAMTQPTIVVTHFVVINAVIASLQNTDQTLVFWPDYVSVTQIQNVAGRLSIVALGADKRSRVN